MNHLRQTAPRPFAFRSIALALASRRLTGALAVFARPLVLVGLLALVPAAGGQAAEHRLEFFVSLEGNDQWSGRHAEPNADRTDGPFRTLQRARDAIRQLKKAKQFPNGGVTVLVRGGLYELDVPLELTREDSGRDGAPVIYRP
ncbi:MAG: hypothetical protein GXP27_02975, partial [Planctomycetes bacterium]|nr:hypothetical protein [Planctomycetota bacterium]